MMMTYDEHNSELIEWGLRFFESSPGPSSEYCSDFTHFPGHEQFSKNIENDEIIAHLIQSDSSEAVDFQPSVCSEYTDDFPKPDYVRSWYYCQPSHIIYSEYENGEEEMIDVEHVPRINGELPTSDEATSDYERLRKRLEFCGLSENKVQGDGNCQFRALSDQLYHTPENHLFVRQQVVNQLRSHRKYYEGYVTMDYSDYLKKTLESGAWGDHVTLQAAADLYGVKIIVVTSFKDTFNIEILPKVQKSTKVLYLSFWAEVHYNSIYPQHTDLSMELAITKSPKKKWWNFTSKR